MRMICLAVIIVAIASVVGVVDASAEPARPVRVSVGNIPSPTGRLADQELKHYLSRMFSNSIDFSGKSRAFEIIVGTSESNPLIRKAVAI